MIDGNDASRLLVVDSQWEAVPIDLMVGDLALLPSGTAIEGRRLLVVRETEDGVMAKAISPGIERCGVSGSTWAAFIRVRRRFYAGRSLYRHLEESEDE